MRHHLILTCLILTVAPAMADVTLTNDRGGSVEVSRDCTRVEDKATCIRETQLTGAEGNTFSKTRIRTAERGYLATSVTATGPRNNTWTRDRSFSRRD